VRKCESLSYFLCHLLQKSDDEEIKVIKEVDVIRKALAEDG
jgi:hypothetical protein